MSTELQHYLPWLLSAITIYMTVLAGNKHPKAWAFGLFNQALWLVWIAASETWGLLPMNAALWLVYGRNHFKWQKAPQADGFAGDNAHLVRSIDALLALDAAGVLAPHGVGGHGRTLLSAAASRLRAQNTPQPPAPPSN